MAAKKTVDIAKSPGKAFPGLSYCRFPLASGRFLPAVVASAYNRLAEHAEAGTRSWPPGSRD
jgi:hypothetical protein